jgi:DNA-binding XRE family transcriptional regulator
MKPEELKMYRNAIGLTRKQFASIVGYDEQYIYLLETGRNPIVPKTEQQVRSRLIEEKESYREVIDRLSEIMK